MAGKQSGAMTKAIAAIKNKGMSPPEAARKYGVTANGIYRRPDYKLWRAEQKKAAE